MKTIIFILTIELVATMKIIMVYFGLYELESYFHIMNTLVLCVYSVIAVMAIIIFMKGQINERQRNTSISN
jgi:hypothetical protein